MGDFIVSVLLSAHIERCSVPRMQDFSFFICKFVLRYTTTMEGLDVDSPLLQMEVKSASARGL